MNRVGCEHLAESASSRRLPRRASFLANRFSLEFEGIDKYRGYPVAALLALPPYCSPAPFARAVMTPESAAYHTA